MISDLKIPLGNIFILRNQNTFAFGCHLEKCLTLKATAVPVCLEIRQFGSGRNRCVGAVCMWTCICTEVLPHKSGRNCLLIWPCNVFIRNVHAQYSSAFRHTTVILEIERNGIISLVWEKSILFPQVLNWCMIEMKEGVAPITFLSTTERQSWLSFQSGAVPESWLKSLQILKNCQCFLEQ